MAKWIRPSGSVIELNDDPATVAEAKALGWKLEEAAPAKEPAKPSKPAASTKK